MSTQPLPYRHEGHDAFAAPAGAFVDDTVARYIAWRQSEAGVTKAYQSWRAAPGGERSSAFSRYLAALDQEDHAAARYADAVNQVQLRMPHRAPSVAPRISP